MLKLFGSSNIKLFVEKVLDDMGEDLRGKSILDVPAGSGFTSSILKKHGADVHAYDLFPEFFKLDGVECKKIDLSYKLAIDDDSMDMIICQEGIEHLPNPLLLLQEFNRILKKGGTLILTTPNISHLRSKFSYFLSESDFYKRMPPNELDAVWHSNDKRIYFGHLFLIGIQKIRVLSLVAGFKITKIHDVKLSIGSLFFIFLYPLLAFANIYAYLKNTFKRDGILVSDKKRVYGEIVKFNLHPSILFGKHLLLELKKVDSKELVVRSSQEGII